MKKYLSKLQKNALFFGFKEEDLLKLLTCLSIKVVSYEKEQCIFMQGDFLSQIGIVLSGSARIEKLDKSGNVSLITELNSNDIFAEAFLCAGIRQIPVSIWANRNCEIMLIDYCSIISPCENVCTYHTKLIENMLLLMAQKLIFLNRKIDIMQSGSTRKKLISFFESFDYTVGVPFTIQFNRSELAQYMGVNRSALSRELSKMRSENIINFSGNSFTVNINF